MKKYLKVSLCLISLILLIVCSSAAAEGCSDALKICSELIIPSLFPFFILSGVITALQLPQNLGKALSPAAYRLFGVSGVGATAFISGILCGYPMGAAYIADMKKQEIISQKEAERLMGFCSNSGFGFIIGAVGRGVFGSVRCGVFLYITHILSALTVGILMKKKFGKLSFSVPDSSVHSQSDTNITSVLTESVKKAVLSILYVCGFIVFFSVIVRVLDAYGALSLAVGFIAGKTGAELTWLRSLCYGFFELGCSFGQMRTLLFSPASLTLASFILGWGGLSVHLQALSIARSAEIKGTLHITGHLLCAGIAAIYTYILSFFLF